MNNITNRSIKRTKGKTNINGQQEKKRMKYFLIEIEKSDFIDNRLTTDTHLRKRHLNLSNEQHTHRIADPEQTNYSSSFPSEEIMQEEIRACLRNKRNLKKLVNWLVFYLNSF